MLIAQLTDTHIKPANRLAYNRVDTYLMLKDAIEHLKQLPQKPDLILLTGDLVDAGSIEEYERLNELLVLLPAPYLLIPGNHDDRNNMRKVFKDHPWISEHGFWQFDASSPDWPLRIIGLDSVNDGQSSGLLCQSRLEWLEDTLMLEDSKPTLIMIHHPPFQTGIGHMDDIGLEGKEEFAKILDRHSQIELVICGHLHRNIRATVGGRAVMTGPSTAHTVQLDLATDAASMFRMEPPGYLLHWWNGTGLVTHHVPAVFSPGPFPFFDDSGKLLL
jgi:3',5'-cyclic AMP phosphodiesterase CpdA